MTIESLTEKFKQFNKEFKLWVETDFKELLDTTDNLVEQTGALVTQTESSNKMLDDIISNTQKIIQKMHQR